MTLIMKKNSGYAIIEVMLATGIFAASSLMLLESTTAQQYIGSAAQSKNYANSIVHKLTSACAGSRLQEKHIQGIFPNGQPYVLDVTADRASKDPMERIEISISWNDLASRKVISIKESIVKIR